MNIHYANQANGGGSTVLQTTLQTAGPGVGLGGPLKGDHPTTPSPVKRTKVDEGSDGLPQQLELEFTPQKETRAERCKRLLSGDLGHVVKPASELMFDYDKATAIATAPASWRGSEQSVGTTFTYESSIPNGRARGIKSIGIVSEAIA